MCNACMVDGFGWFHEVDYRRTWLLFRDVDYVFPTLVPGVYPNYTEAPPAAFRVRTLAETDETVRARIDSARALSDNLALSSALDQTPARDLEYAARVVRFDANVQRLGPDATVRAPRTCFVYLACKLLDYSCQETAVPIIGNEHARRVLMHVIASRHAARLDGLASPRQGITYQAFGAGLSFHFLSDQDVMAPTWTHLGRFKDRNRGLLERHQLHLLSVVAQFCSSLESPSFLEHVAVLRQEAEQTRRELDDLAHDAWLDGGLRLVKKGITGAAAGGLAGLGLAAGTSQSGGTIGIMPVALGAVGLGVSEAISAAIRAWRARRVYVTYLLKAQKSLRH